MILRHFKDQKAPDRSLAQMRRMRNFKMIISQTEPLFHLHTL